MDDVDIVRYGIIPPLQLSIEADDRCRPEDICVWAFWANTLEEARHVSQSYIDGEYWRLGYMPESAVSFLAKKAKRNLPEWF